MIDIIGLIGSVCFAVCGIPAAMEAYKAKYCNYNKIFLSLWLTGELACIIYAIGISKPILLINYGGNLICLLVIIYYNKSKQN